MTPLASPVGDLGFPKSPGAWNLLLHFLEWRNERLGQHIQMCAKYLPISMTVARTKVEGAEEMEGMAIHGEYRRVCEVHGLHAACVSCMGHVRADHYFIPLSRAQRTCLSLNVKIFH